MADANENNGKPDQPTRFRRILTLTLRAAYGGAVQLAIGAAVGLAIAVAVIPVKQVTVPGEVVVIEKPMVVAGPSASPDSATTGGMGWICDPDAVQVVANTLPVKVFADTPAGQVDDLPPFVYGWKYYEKLYGRPPPIKDQGQVGSCVSFGTNTAVERTLAAEILARKGAASEWSRFTEEATYGGSRVEIGGGQIRGDGSVGAWAAQFVTKYGMVPRQKYADGDLTDYSEDRCRAWGRSGVPAWGEAVSRKFPVKQFVQVKTWEDVKKAAASGYFVAVCSNQGFASKRDTNGVAKASGSWAHCMACDGYHTENGKEYGHIVNSWNTTWISGPVGWGEPGGDGFWAESAVIDRMVKQGDSWAFSGVTGFPARHKLDWFIYHVEPRKTLGFDRANLFTLAA